MGDSLVAGVREVVSTVVVSDDNVDGVVTVSAVEAVIPGGKVVDLGVVVSDDNVDGVVIVSDVKVVGTGSEIIDTVACRCTICMTVAPSSIVRGPKPSHPADI